MVTNLYEYFKNDFSNIENELIELIKNDWILVCVWICDSNHVEALPTDDMHQKYYAGYYMYVYDHDDMKILQMRDEIVQEITGEISADEGGMQESFISESALRNMICNAHIAGQKSIVNPYIDYTREDDFFAQWTLNENEPDRMILLEPTENWRSDVYDKEKWKKAKQYILHWADKYPKYRVAPSMDYIEIAENFCFLSDKGLCQEAIDCIYQTTPGLFDVYDDSLVQYCDKLKEKFGEDYCHKLNDIYLNDTEQFKELFSAETIELALGY